MKPFEVEEAALVDGLCRRYSQPPSVILAEDVSMLQRLAIMAAAVPPEEG